MKEFMEYKGYLGSVELSEEDEVLYGKVQFIRDTILYEGTDTKGIIHAFHEAVDDYLAVCERQGKEPDKPFKGSFQVRTGPELHRNIALLAIKSGTSLNKVVTEALQEKLERAAG